MTDITIKLSAALSQKVLDAPANDVDVYAYAYVFQTSSATVVNGKPVTSQSIFPGGQLVIADPTHLNENSDGELVAPTLSINSVTSPLAGGQIYVVIQQVAKGTAPEDVAVTHITKPSDIIQGAIAHNFNYQLIELSLENSQYDDADITAINSFGLSTTLSVTNGTGSDAVTETRGYNVTSNWIFSQAPNATTVPKSANEALGFDYSLAQGPASSTSWTTDALRAYLLALAHNPEELAKIQIADFSQGGVASTPGNYVGTTLNNYHLMYVPGNAAYDPAHPASDGFDTGTFYLVPDTSYGAYDPSASQVNSQGFHGFNTNWIEIPFDKLVDNIYTQTWPLVVNVGGPYGPAQTYPDIPAGGGSYNYGTVRGFTPNTPDGDVSKILVAGLDAGYWGMKGVGAGTSPADAALGKGLIDLSKSFNWDVKFAYDGAMGGTVQAGAAGPAAYDKWAQAFVASSNVYGYPYTDLIAGAGGVSPLVGLWDSKAGVNSEQITITVNAPDEVGTGFTLPAQTYWDPTGIASTSGYLSPVSVKLSFFAALSNSQVTGKNGDGTPIFATNMYALDPNITAKLYMYDSTGKQEVFLVDPSGNELTTGFAGNYNITWDSVNSRWIATNSGNPNPGQTYFNFIGFPTPASSEYIRYEFVAGAGTENEASYNFFLTQRSGSANEVMLLGADHGVDISSSPNLVDNNNGQTFQNYTLDALPGRLTFAPELLALRENSQNQATAGNSFNVGKVDYITAATTGPKSATNFDDSITGNAGTNFISGLGGDDVINGGSGQDFIYGNAGNDTIVIKSGQAMYDWISGGDGVDTLSFSGIVYLAGFSTFASEIEIISTQKGTLSGDRKDDFFDLGGLIQDPNAGAPAGQPYFTISGGAGSDTVYGSSFGDIILGESLGKGGRGSPNDHDRLYGVGGNDSITGGKGSDVVVGGKGDDMLTGGGGGDVFVYATGDGHDTVKDFVHGSDLIDLTGYSGANAGNVSITAQAGGYEVSVSGSGIMFVLGTAPTIDDFVF